MTRRELRRRVRGVIFGALLIFVLSPACSRAPGGSAEHATLEERVFTLVNRYRREQGLAALDWHDVIAAEAREHSRNMAAGRVPAGHEGADERVEDIGERIRVAAFAENVALNQGYDDPAREAVQGWIESPGHRKNLLGEYSLTGVGVAVSADSAFYFTQIYIEPR